MSNVNNKWINLCFIIDASGSMYSSREDVIGGFKKVIDEQKAIKDGKATVSLYTFNDTVTEKYIGVDVNDIEKFEYDASGLTAMNDGIGIAITNMGKWLYERDKNNEEMPSKTLVVVMTDGMENSSKEYTLERVREMIKEQSEKYSWEFIYMGSDITTSNAADELGFKFKTYGSKKSLFKNYNIINTVTSSYRASANAGTPINTLNESLAMMLEEEAEANTKEYESEIGRKITSV